MSRRIRKFDYRVQGKIQWVMAAVVELDGNIISNEDYLLIKDKNLNDESDLLYVADHILKSPFLLHSPEHRREMIQSIDFILTSELDLIDHVFSLFNLATCYVVEDKPLFLRRIKSILESYYEEDG